MRRSHLAHHVAERIEDAFDLRDGRLVFLSGDRRLVKAVLRELGSDVKDATTALDSEDAEDIEAMVVTRLGQGIVIRGRLLSDTPQWHDAT